MPEKPVFCFIDDAQFELDNFRENAAWAFERVDFVYTTTFELAVKLIAKRPVLCFILDLYGTDPDQKRPRLLSAGTLAKKLGRPAGLDEMYQDLDPKDPEGRNLFLRRLYGQVEAWQGAFLLACQALGQGRAYGAANLTQARREYPHAAALGYSRKALYADAVEISLLGADALLQKPQGADDAAIAEATRHLAPRLAQAAYDAVDSRLTAAIAPLGLSLCARGNRVGELIHQALIMLPVIKSEAAQRETVAVELIRASEDGDQLRPELRKALKALAAWLVSA